MSSDEHAFDAIFYVAGSSDGYRLIFGMERRRKGIIGGVLYIQIPNRGLFRLPRLPDTILFGTTNGQEGKGYEAEGMRCVMIEPMKKWKIYYKGDLK